MNKQRRESIQEIANKLEEVKKQVDEILQGLEDIKSDEQDYLDNIPENLQNSERYSTSEEAIDCLDNVLDELNSTDFESAIDYLQRAIEN